MSEQHRGFVFGTACLVMLILASDAQAEPITLTFEDLPDSRLYPDESIGDFYAGVTFSPGVYGFKEDGNTAIVAAGISALSIEFADPIFSFAVRYGSFDPLPVGFFSESGALLGAVTGLPTWDNGRRDRWDVLRFTGEGIRSVTAFGADPGLFVLDDVTYDTVPEPATLLMLGVGLGGVFTYRRSKARRNVAR
jgi:hypothetical protein